MTTLDQILDLVNFQTEILKGSNQEATAFAVLDACYERLVDLEMELEK